MTGNASYEVGKGKPPKHTRFQPGNVGNPKGKTSNQKNAEMRAAEIAAQLEQRLLAALAAQDDATLISSLSGGDIARMIKTAMDREFGTATQKVEASGSNGGPMIIQWKNADS
jgi:hypothetical protein